ncbi:hypothetical protein N7537_008053 [Penicillium hordei]|uniref:Uncharacterized protein n=1 Tax=Penicillium hordei TaxID=40994 RepID=A0AAD6DZT0_9EURO|nr:uncharacterized protein N7537_008053 [Penicillium hordei]KAJ5597969.1 hypothetical protein N7537_008053 [Penicillium hordei]
MDSAGREFPHFKAVIYNDLEADCYTCFRGEVLISLRLMLGQLSKVRLVHHQIAPKTKSLMMRSSDLYELNNKTSISEAFKTLTEYFLGAPVGTTV